MKLVVGLGNPLDKYKYTRHNAGYIVIDNYCKSNQIKLNLNKKLNSFLSIQKDAIFCKPNVYMNESGISVLQVAKYYNIKYTDILIVHDDLDLDFGQIKFSCSRGPAGHNGVKDIINRLGTKDFCRVRIGIGKPTNNTPIENYVLQNFTNTELDIINKINLNEYLLLHNNKILENKN